MIKDKVAVLICTHKCLDKIMADPEWLKISKSYEVQATTLIYINMLDGCTEEECDNVIYIVPDTSKKNWLVPQFEIKLE